jgi:enoyl-CoA hydratase
LENEAFSELCGTRDKNEGVTAFLEKRKPEFQGK